MVISSDFKLADDIRQVGMRENIPIEKGIILTEQQILKNRDLYEKYGNLFTAYPDLFLDLITPADSQFKLFFYQRICKKSPAIVI